MTAAACWVWDKSPTGGHSPPGILSSWWSLPHLLFQLLMLPALSCLRMLYVDCDTGLLKCRSWYSWPRSAGPDGGVVILGAVQLMLILMLRRFV